MPPTLSKDDWIEIAAALAARFNWLQDYLPNDEDEIPDYEAWAEHIATILETIGGDGEAMWPAEETP